MPVQARMAALVKLFLSGSGIQEGSRLSCVDTQLGVRVRLRVRIQEGRGRSCV